ncbi:NAD(P)/FAD-dependent oxidoreductase [Ureibacillus sp. FSL K6-8385]|uniref:NAD(P)/FAD-dependent oxidoreductase n=1 Tax=Ureibacillus terrenus TaxID=118246 RepID=A0A540V0Y2_9BACL|nr:NAD(P)/FAD-dependent oxidoreductase [Ureibacillus terrenus]MED3662207.1 NAD(P)/FAD-dependent oxidoreductase [Ureibacillus terrenus]MED3765137.1 NAD(P)/FAD-dependent oxidoreductase [Ureibacillus terrenus]TQE90367.1 NAD(P)/FAD-dependent oxidoreductase [Ureibacillus terrenus]
MSKEIVILGAGYGGLLTALTLRKYASKEEAKITVVNKTPDHQLITELHRLAGGTISEKAISFPLKKLFKGKDIDVVIQEVKSFNVNNKEVYLANGSVLSYDYLVVALGSQTGFFGIPGLEENSMVLKSIDDAKKIYNHIESKIASYAKTKDPADATIVIGGGGLTGVELVGEIVDNAPNICAKYAVDPAELNIILVEAAPKILPVLPDELIERAMKSLEARGVKFLTGLPVTGVEGNVISLKDGSTITANTFVWTGGVAALPIVQESGLECDRGKGIVDRYLRSVSHPDVFVIGDASVCFPEGGGRPLYAPTAQNAWQMGEATGYNLYALIKGQKLKEFSPVNSGTLASLGRKDGVATVGKNNILLKGLPASLMKEASHVRYLSHIKALYGLAY